MSQKKKGRGARDAGPSKVDNNQRRSSNSSTFKSQEEIAVYDGLRQRGTIKPHGSAFEAYAVVGASLEYLGKALSRSEAARLIREARP
jgi:hypothetical protein